MATSKHQIPDFEISAPDETTSPVIFNSPHSGSYYRPDFIAASRLTPLSLRKSEDSFVDEIFSAMPTIGCPLLKANFPRAFLDVNRAPWELDQKMFSDILPPYAETKTIRVAAGLGTIARNVTENEKIYRKKLTFAEAKARIERYYFPYHLALEKLIATAREQFGQAILIDCHSMPSSAVTPIMINNRRKKPDIILGDRYGTSCNNALLDHLEYLFDNTGLNTTRNKPYAGGFITCTYGQPAQSVHAIQIEINRSLYMDEKTIRKTAGFEPLKAVIGDIFNTFVQSLPQSSSQPSLAAE